MFLIIPNEKELHSLTTLLITVMANNFQNGLFQEYRRIRYLGYTKYRTSQLFKSRFCRKF